MIISHNVTAFLSNDVDAQGEDTGVTAALAGYNHIINMPVPNTVSM